MLSELFFDGNFFPRDVFSVVNRRVSAFKEIYNNRNHSEERMVKKLENMAKKYHNFCLYVPMRTLKADSMTLEQYVESDEKNPIGYVNLTMFYLFMSVLKSVVSKVINVIGYGARIPVKYTYLFAQSNQRSNGYDHVIIIFSVSNTDVELELLAETFTLFSDMVCNQKSKRITINDRKYTQSGLIQILKYYFFDFLKNNDHLSYSFYPSDDNTEPFCRFLSQMFYLEKPRCLFDYFHDHTLKHCYQLKTTDFSSILSTKCRRIMLPKIANIFVKAINDIDSIRSVAEIEQHLSSGLQDDHLVISDMMLKSISDTMRKDGSPAASKQVVDDKESRVTIHRTLIAYRLEIRNRILPLFNNDQHSLKSVSDVLEKMMFRFYCIFARSPSASLSSVGEAIHQHRISSGADLIKQSEVTKKMNQIVSSKTITGYGSYDIYRLLTSYEMTSTFCFRKSIVFVYELLSENLPSIYDSTIKLANNFFIIGDPGGGKDLILETIDNNHIPSTIFKETRSSACADASESHGRHDDEVVYNVEKSLEPMMNNKSYHFSGNGAMKDRMTSSKSVTRVLVVGSNGSRQTKVIVNERKVMFYDASNPSVISRIDGGFIDRYTWIFMMPTTHRTTTETVALLTQQKIANGDVDTEMRRKSFIDDQRFIQMASYEMSKFNLICHSEMDYQGIYHIIQFMIKGFERDAVTYGCRPISQRKINVIIMLAKCHAMRRIVVKTFFKQRPHGQKIYSPKYLFNHIVSTGKFHVSTRDLVLSLGQMSHSIGLFSVAEVQMLTAMRCIFIRTEHLSRSKKVGSMFRLFKLNPRYVVFPNDPKEVASRCLEVLLEIWNTEENAPKPINYETCLDFITQLFDVDNQSRDMCKRPVTQTPDIYSHVYLNKHSGHLSIMNRTFVNDDAVRQEPNIQRNAKNNTIMIHIRYLNRLFDPEMVMFPWSDVMPKKWSPMIDEDVLIKKHLERFFSYQHQHKDGKQIVYRLERTRNVQNKTFSNSSDPFIRNLSEHRFNCLNVHSYQSERPFMISTMKVTVPLLVSIDEMSRTGLS
jgi:hypothetical protein